MRIALFGSNGRVGSKVLEIALQRGHSVAEIEKNSPPSDIDEVDVTIDFSAADATAEVCEFCLAHRCPLVTGVTGRTEQQEEILQNAAKEITVISKANFSEGMETVYRICKILATLRWDCDIVETHHRQKADRPGGTAKQLACEITQNGTRRVTVHSLRNGSNFGKHEIVFATEGESITVVHQAENIGIFALGAVKCAEKIVEQA